MNLKQMIGYIRSRASRGGYVDGLLPSMIRTLGGKYWKLLPNKLKLNYLKSTQHMLIDNPDFDPHLAEDLDPDFQKTIISGVALFIQVVDPMLTDEYKKSKAVDWPKALRDYISKNLGGYTYEGLLKAIALYQNNPDIEKSRAKRFVLSKEGSKPKSMPLSLIARKHTWHYYDQVAEGEKLLRTLPVEEQHEMIASALPGHSLSGYPSFGKQTHDNIVDLTIEFCDLIGFKKPIKKNDKYYLTVDYVNELIDFCEKAELYFPFIALYRSHFDKVRAIFGGNWKMKLYGCVFVASKHLGYTKDICTKLNIPCNEDKYDVYIEKEVDVPDIAKGALSGAPTIKKTLKYLVTPQRIYSPGNIPYISQLNWDSQFRIYADKLPPVQDGKVQKVSDDWIKDHFNVTLPRGEYDMNVIGDDYSKFDTTVLYEDMVWLTEHSYYGDLFKKMLHEIYYSEVWLGTERIFDVLFKSGFPFTQNFGTDIHRQRNYLALDAAILKHGGKKVEISKRNALDLIKKIDGQGIFADIILEDGKYYTISREGCDIPLYILGNTNQSDDSIIFVIGLLLNEMEEYLTSFGLMVSGEESGDFQRDKFVTFLQMHIGYIIKDIGHAHVIGNFISRYLKLAHSEREIDVELGTGDLVGVFVITGDAMIDSGLGKFSSLGKDSKLNILPVILYIIKDTLFGRRLIRAMGEIDPNKSYELYRSDVAFGMNPAWLGTVNVQELLTSDWLRKVTAI